MGTWAGLPEEMGVGGVARQLLAEGTGATCQERVGGGSSSGQPGQSIRGLPAMWSQEKDLTVPLWPPLSPSVKRDCQHPPVLLRQIS